jgi:hypothetical protein
MMNVRGSGWKVAPKKVRDLYSKTDINLVVP